MTTDSNKTSGELPSGEQGQTVQPGEKPVELDADAQEYQRRMAVIRERQRVREALTAEVGQKSRDEMVEIQKRLNAPPFDRKAYERESREAVRVIEDHRNAERAKKGLPPEHSLTESMKPKVKIEEPDLTDLSVERLSPQFVTEARACWEKKDFDSVIDFGFQEACRLMGGDYGDADDQMEDMKDMGKLVGKMEGRSFEDFLAAFIKLERFEVYKKG